MTVIGHPVPSLKVHMVQSNLLLLSTASKITSVLLTSPPLFLPFFLDLLLCYPLSDSFSHSMVLGVLGQLVPNLTVHMVDSRVTQNHKKLTKSKRHL